MPVDMAAEVTSNTPLSPQVNVIALAAPAIAEAVEPGQFVMVRAASGHDPLLRRPFSVFQVLRDASGAPTGISLFSKRVGPATSLLYDARSGQRLPCLGPLGNAWRIPDGEARSREVFMVAGGVGLAAFAILAERLTARGVAATLFYGARSADELFYLDFFRSAGVRLVLTTEDGSMGERGRITSPLERELALTDRPPIVYACGPEAMMKAAAAIASRAGAPCFVSMERIMGCGLGGCYSCVVAVRSAQGGSHHVRSCLAGPVMAGDQIVWDSPN
jgi:dihydroorotate dehydrogenase electron transfer subunit